MSRKDAFTPDHLTSKGILACPCGKGAGRAGEKCPHCGIGLFLRGPATAVQAGEQAGQAKPERKRREMSKTEARYAQILDLQVRDGTLRKYQYEGVTFTLDAGFRYTPDFVCEDMTGRLLCIEVKGSYRLGSYQRSRLAFLQARTEWPSIRFIWAERENDGTWRTRE